MYMELLTYFFWEATGPSVSITSHSGAVEPAGCQILSQGTKKAMARKDRPQDAWGLS